MIPAPERMLSDLIRLDTTNPPGNEFKVARYLKEIFEAAGIDYEIIESEAGRANFIARLGSGSRKLLFLSHSDVVPAGEGWDYDPFSGEIADGVIWGRGALDCKGLMAAQVNAVLRLAKEAAALNGTLLFAATADEERGGGLGVRYLLENCPEKIRADFVVNEGGEGPRRINGRQIYFVQVGEKGTAWSKLHAGGYSCHGSVPNLGDNAVLKMARALNSLAGYQPEIRFIPEVRFLLQELLPLKGLNEPLTETNVDVFLDSLEERSFAETLRAMTRLTISPNTITGGSKTNVVPDSCTAGVDIRILPGQDRDYVTGELRRLIGGEIEIEIANFVAPTFTTSQADPYRLIVEATQEIAGADVLCLPHISPGATDSRFLRAAGIPAYGIGHMAREADPELGATIHGKNERIDLASLHFRADFFLTLAKKYLC
ncbi:MAG: M20/M25/M40 family metallo-hydrolase [Firmicutes bacterium]|nr:M20/M25/M40 family metallo-hydrolase [Bacillota bacterium]